MPKRMSTRYRVTRRYVDKHTRETHEVGDIVYPESDRARELAEKGRIEPVRDDTHYSRSSPVYQAEGEDS